MIEGHRRETNYRIHEFIELKPGSFGQTFNFVGMKDLFL